MKTFKWAFACIVAILACGFVFTGCDDGSTNNQATDNTVYVTGVTLAGDAEFGLLIDETKTLSYTVSPANATNKRVSWISSSPRVVSVVDGLITALSEGTATITVITDDGRKSASCTVTVGRIVVTGVELPETFDLWVGDEEILPATVLPENAANKSLLWETSDSSVVTVSDNGTVFGVVEGTATITVRTHNSMTANCVVIVTNVDVTDVELPATFSVGLWSSQVLPHTVLPLNATFPGVSWESDDEEVATVSADGVVTGVELGTTTITVTTDEGGFTATCTVTVVLPNINIPLVLIPSGTFTMGVPNDEDGWSAGWIEYPQHQVTLKSFYMSTYQVSQELYKNLMGVNPSYFNVEGFEDLAEFVDDWPVDCVSWYDAVEFCNRLSYITGLEQVYTITDRYPETGYPITFAEVTCDWAKNGYRLPTEAEWEYACRAGTTTPFNFMEHTWEIAGSDWWYEELYAPVSPTGNWGSEYIWLDWANFDAEYDYNGRNTDMEGYMYGNTLPWWYFSEENHLIDNPGDYANEWGLYNMHGNLEEWCWDWVDSYSASPATNPKGPDDPPNLFDYPFRALRGGSWCDPAAYLRSGARNGAVPWASAGGDSVFGFRVVRNGDGPLPEPSPRAVIKRSKPAKMIKGLNIVPQKSTRNFDRNSAPSIKLESLRRKLVK
jgi:uncharacterized protein YjdB